MDGVNGGSTRGAAGAQTLLGTEAEVEQTFVEAARAGKLVRLVEDGERERLAEPHMVYRDRHGRLMLHLYQVGGYSSSRGDGRGWRNVPLGRFAAAEVVDQRFVAQPDYNPMNEEKFPHVVFAIPTRDGRTREPDSD
jgi:hypothetical protein